MGWRKKEKTIENLKMSRKKNQINSNPSIQNLKYFLKISQLKHMFIIDKKKITIVTQSWLKNYLKNNNENRLNKMFFLN